MTREETKHLIEVMQAYVNGKPIEYKSGGEWKDIDKPNWLWVSANYRIKPEPKYRPYATRCGKWYKNQD